MLKQDARKTQRMPAYLGAKIIFAHKPSTFDCLVRNTSDTGAQITIESIRDIPETFRLHIEKFNKSFDCRTIWMAHNKLGVQYC